jgi:hypothetical protein
MKIFQFVQEYPKIGEMLSFKGCNRLRRKKSIFVAWSTFDGKSLKNLNYMGLKSIWGKNATDTV